MDKLSDFFLFFLTPFFLIYPLMYIIGREGKKGWEKGNWKRVTGGIRGMKVIFLENVGGWYLVGWPRNKSFKLEEREIPANSSGSWRRCCPPDAIAAMK